MLEPPAVAPAAVEHQEAASAADVPSIISIASLRRIFVAVASASIHFEFFARIYFCAIMRSCSSKIFFVFCLIIHIFFFKLFLICTTENCICMFCVFCVSIYFRTFFGRHEVTEYYYDYNCIH